MAVTVEEKMQPHRLQQMRLKKQCTEAKAKIKIRLVYGFPDQSYIFEQPTLNLKKKKNLQCTNHKFIIQSYITIYIHRSSQF